MAISFKLEILGFERFNFFSITKKNNQIIQKKDTEINNIVEKFVSINLKTDVILSTPMICIMDDGGKRLSEAWFWLTQTKNHGNQIQNGLRHLNQ